MQTPEFVYEDMKRSYGDLRLAPIPPDFDNFVQRTVEQLHEIGKEILSQIEEREEEEDMEIEDKISLRILAFSKVSKEQNV